MTNFANIGSYDIYNDRMAKAIMDKLFFVDKIEADLIVDFGSADGTLLHHIHRWLPDVKLMGYDNDPKMVLRAKDGLESKNAGIEFTGNWDFVKNTIVSAKKEKWKTALILSSIIHEIYHYSEPKEIDTFWEKVFTSGFDYIVIRDMMPSRSVDRHSDINDIAKVYRKFLDSKELKDFENRWGSIENNKNLTHFLLKYNYVKPNWDREVKENYIPLYREDMLAMLPMNYNVSYHEHFVLPWLRGVVKNDFGIELKDNTHLKLILEKADG